MTGLPDILSTSTIELAPGVRALPIVHGSFECAVLVRRIFQEAPPGLCALELPERLEPALRDALGFADQFPIITLRDPAGAAPLHFVLEPLEPLVEAARSAFEAGIALHLIDDYQEVLPGFFPEEFPDTYSLRTMDLRSVYELYRQREDRREPVQIDRLREKRMSLHLRNLSRVAGDRWILVVCGMRHVEGLRALLAQPDPDDDEPLEALWEKRERLESFQYEKFARGTQNISVSTLERQSAEVLSQPGYFNTAWIFARRNPTVWRRFNRVTLQRQVYRETVQRYERETGELVPPQREKLFFRFARNWSILQKQLLPDLYRMVVSARAFGNDDFARIMYDILSLMPPVANPAAPPARLTLDDLFKDRRLLRLRPRPKWKARKGRDLPGQIRKRIPRERYPGEWSKAWRDGGICSYPPEDLVIEDFGRYLQKSATRVLRGSEEKVLPFTASLMDGIDYRETIRNYHLGRIFVKDLHVQGIEAGSVVIIFAEDEAQYDWRVVWWGEHSGESDMAFYATAPGLRFAGPGICQSRYGGLMMSYPPGRLHDVWNDPDYGAFTRPADRLLAAAIEYNEKRAVVHLASRPPARRLVQLAARFGQKVIHIPLSTMNPVLLGRVRRFHVLDSRDRRDDAGDYIR